MSKAITFSKVTQSFERRGQTSIQALDDLSFEIGAREFVSVLGPSGCGKSTLLQLLSGLLMPSHGTISVNDQKVTGPRDDVGIVFQKPTLLPWFDVVGNVTFPIRHKGLSVTSEIQDRAQELLELVGLKEFSARRVDELSGGMQQRVSIARALLLDPDILLMDEPFSALDALTRDEMSFELLRIWSAKKKTVLFITHSIPEALLLSDRIIVMTPRPGRVMEEINCPFQRPRSQETLGDPRFAELSNHIRGSLLKDNANQPQ
ncbi:ABC transporter ATP-binding protein [Roseibaca sp. V10]|uniref:ABC transporter ATP-binding protein n=1 Tax=Roseinatronobacter domitianus TaxID=2940293 RepID=A0ABT0M4X7_9RHOB|nr:ABC transporter ATP-binding protein [Roseibaca domitiana]MCL1629921.1 ABC transporter ATP-binding protein [Roseibaca domitiana]